MRKTKIIVTLLCLWLGLMPLAAQSVTITKDFAQVPMASVLAMYKNEFGSYEKPDMTDTFPYAVIRMHLEGSNRAVREAKERLTLYMGQQMGVERRVTTYSNQILFLVRSRHPMIYIDCGDGCERVLLSNMQQLKSNCVYDFTVRYEPENEGGDLDKDALLDVLRAELVNMVQSQQDNQNKDAQVKDVEDTHVEEPVAPVVQEDTLSKYQRYAQNAKVKTLVMGQMGYSVAPQLSYGAMVGQMYKGYGWYLKGRSNFHFAPSANLVCDANGSIDGDRLFFSGNTSATHYAVSGGFMMNFIEKKTKSKFNTFGCYIGGGYGKREMQWETADGKWVTYAPTSYKGFAGDIGLMGSLCGVTLSLGVSTINFQYVELEVGVGFMF